MSCNTHITNRELSRSNPPMPSVVFVARALPSDIGPGGKHRTYQIEHDLKAGFGADCVHTLSLMEWRSTHTDEKSASTKTAQFARRIVRRLSDCLENPLAILHGTGYGSHTFTPRGFIQEYRALLERLPRPIITVVDDARFSGIVTIAKQSDVPVIACTHNLESLDLAAADAHGSWGLRTHLVDLANEFELLQRCDGRLFISKVETGLVSGLAMEAEYYPYRPVGAIRRRLEAIRQARMQCEPDPGLFLLLGSAMHGTTRRAFEWFLTQARKHGVPQGIRLVLAGMDTDKLDLRGTAGIEALGWVSQPALDRLLVAARAVVVPQFNGFGAVTRLVELSCAGVPALVSTHPTRASDVPPGVHVLGESWPEWQALLRDLARAPRQSDWDYQAWEATQPQPLHRYLSRWIQEA
jgi:hypothetical protein